MDGFSTYTILADTMGGSGLKTALSSIQRFTWVQYTRGVQRYEEL